MPSKKALVVVTSVGKYPDMEPARATGLWLGEAVHFVKKIEEHGFSVDYVSPQGGYVPIDPMSLQMADETDWKYYADKEFMTRLANSKKPSEVNPSDYSIIYYAGGHGTVFDFKDNKELQDISTSIYEAGGVVSSVCHGAIGLLNIKLSDGTLLIKDKKVTGFSNSEEKEVGLDEHVPFLAEDELTARGAHYEKTSSNWGEFAVADQRVVTGQNPASGAAVAEKAVQALQ